MSDLKIIEAMAEAMFTADGHLGTWAEVVDFDTSFADRWRARAMAALTAYEAHATDGTALPTPKGQDTP